MAVVDYAVTGQIAVITLNRPEARNAVNPEVAARLADAWRENAGFIGVQSYATSTGGGEDLPVSILGSGSDYTVFFNHIGVASADLVFDGPYGVYHSVYDTYEWMARQGDPGFLYHAAMARYAGLLALRFANADVLPFDAAAYGREIARYAEELRSLPGAGALAPSLRELAARAREWSGAAGAAQESISSRVAAGEGGLLALRDANAWLLSLERAMLDPPGIPGRPWFRHLIYAPLPSYRAETLPAIREAIGEGRSESAGLQIRRLSEKLEAAIAAAKSLSAAGRRRRLRAGR